MPLPLTTDERDALRSNAIAIRTLIDFHFDAPTGRVSFWDGDEIMAFESTDYIPTSDFGHIGSINMGTDLGAEGLELKLNGTKLVEAVPDGGDPGALFGTIEEETYQLRRVDIRFAFFSAETGALLFTKRRYGGLIDQIRQVEEISQDLERIEEWLVVALESVARRYGVRGGRTRSNEDQQAIHPGDTLFLYTSPSLARAGGLPWGRWGEGQRPSHPIGLPVPNFPGHFYGRG